MTDRSKSQAAARLNLRLGPKVMSALAVCACLAATAAPTSNPALVDLLDVLRSAPTDAHTDNGALTRAGQALRLAGALDLQRASRAINEALQADARNPHLHFFNSSSTTCKPGKAMRRRRIWPLKGINRRSGWNPVIGSRTSFSAWH